MRCRLDADVLAAAVGWVAAPLPARPSLPVLSGVLLEARGDRLRLAGFDHDVTGGAEVDVAPDGTDGRVLVPGQVFARIVDALPPRPVTLRLDGASVVVTCATSRFRLPVLPAGDFPAAPPPPPVAGTVDAAAFAVEAARVAVAATRDDTIPVLTAVRIEFDDDALTLVAIDRYRLAVGRVGWRPGGPVAGTSVLLPARALASVARGLGGAGDVTLAVDPGTPNLVAFHGGGRHRTVRSIDGAFVPYRSITPTAFATRADLATTALAAAVTRVALIADPLTPVHLDLAADGVTVRADSGGGADASEHLPAALAGDGTSVAFNPRYLLDGLRAVAADTVTLSVAAPTRPVLISTAGAPYTYTVMPVRTGQR